MTSTTKTSEARTFEGIDLLISLACVALTGVCSLAIGLAFTVLKNPKATFILAPLGGLALSFLRTMFFNHEKTNRGAWKLAIKDGFNRLESHYKDLKETYPTRGTGWKGLISRIIATVLATVLALSPVLINMLGVLFTGVAFGLIVRVALLVLGK